MAERLRFMWNNPDEVLNCLARAREILPSLSWQSEKDRFCSFYADLMNIRKPEEAASSQAEREMAGARVDG